MNMEFHLTGLGLVFINKMDIEKFSRNQNINFEFTRTTLSIGVKCIKTIYFTIDENEEFLFDEPQNIKEIIQENKINFFIFYSKLSGKQTYELEKNYNVIVYDIVHVYLKSWLINSHDERTKTYINIQKLKYLLPYYQYKCEQEKDDLESRKIILRFYESKLARLKSQKSKKHTSLPVVSFVGHIGTGKSTLFNELVKLYSNHNFISKEYNITIDERTHKIHFHDGAEILIKDNISLCEYIPEELQDIYQYFIQRAFQADLIVFVEDLETINKSFIKETFINQFLPHYNTPQLVVINKVDKSHWMDMLDIEIAENLFLISAIHQLNFNTLESKIKNILFKNWKTCTMFIPLGQSNVLNQIKKVGHLIKIQQRKNGIKLIIRLSSKNYNKYRDYIWIEGKN